MLETIKKYSYPINKGHHLSIAYMGTKSSDAILTELPNEFHIFQNKTLEELQDFLNNQSILTLPDVIIIETDINGDCFKFITQLKKNALWRELIIVLISPSHNKEWKTRALELKVHDFYVLPFPIEHLIERLAFLVKFKLIKPNLSILESADFTYKLPLTKRLFDILIASLVIIMVLPILIITSILIRLDTKGPILYKSKRVGTGYNIFDFYKFRSMRINADLQLKNLSDLNLYKSKVDDEISSNKSVFVKLIDDPRITRIGNFIRRTSIDELPQLFNVIKGDMSLVGNRPLPLYEAEMLTSNDWSLRFMGPAGVTGLWQVKSRGKKDISERDRKKFDNFYASKYSFWFDVGILIKTIPVILHKEKF
jgi:lipopolysaccharide/colanic/teichoic acid biosynthesis glycosyltransferase